MYARQNKQVIKTLVNELVLFVLTNVTVNIHEYSQTNPPERQVLALILNVNEQIFMKKVSEQKIVCI